MTVRDAILLAVPVFAAHARGGLYDIRGGLEAAGVPPALAAEIVEFLPVALARAMLNGMDIRFADHYVRQTSQGQVIGQKLLSDEPVYREGLVIAGEISGLGESEFMAVAEFSPEYRAVRRAMNSGSPAKDIELGPLVVLANDGDRRAFDDTSGGQQPRAKVWWQFWK
jgi:hypothetical protein